MKPPDALNSIALAESAQNIDHFGDSRFVRHHVPEFYESNDGRYTVDPKSIQCGGFGSVFKGHDNVLDLDVALKIGETGLSDTETDLMYREALVLSQNPHPNIPRIFAYTVYREVISEKVVITHPVMVTEWLEGKSLWRTKFEELSVDDISHILEDVASAVDFAHSHNIIHRDLKPANIRVCTNSENEAAFTHAKYKGYLVDFGLSNRVVRPEEIKEKGPSGTPGYMSPEMIKGERPAYSDDYWGICLVAFKAFMGRSFQYDDENGHIYETHLPPVFDKLLRHKGYKKCKSAKLLVQELIAAAKEGQFAIR